MSLSKIVRYVLPAAMLVSGAVATASAASMQSKVLASGKLFGNIPNVTIRGIDAGGAPWVVQGHYALTNSDLVATGKWLIIPKTGFLANGKPIPSTIAGTTAGATSVIAAITFANAPTIYTKAVPLNKKGDFTFDVMLKVPKNAADPVVLIGPGANGKMSSWWASSNFLMDYGSYTSSGSGGTMSSSGGSSGGSSSGGW